MLSDEYGTEDQLRVNVICHWSRFRSNGRAEASQDPPYLFGLEFKSIEIFWGQIFSIQGTYEHAAQHKMLWPQTRIDETRRVCPFQILPRYLP